MKNKADDLEGEALRLLYEHEQGRKVARQFTIAHGLALRKFYQRLLDEKAKCGLVLEGNHP